VSILNHIALIAGYFTLAAGGLLLAIAALLGCGLLLRFHWIRVRNGVDLIEAGAEWRRNHPDKLAANRKRNGVEED
jgi:hypothetical protein